MITFFNQKRTPNDTSIDNAFTTHKIKRKSGNGKADKRFAGKKPRKTWRPPVPNCNQAQSNKFMLCSTMRRLDLGTSTESTVIFEDSIMEDVHNNDYDEDMGNSSEHSMTTECEIHLINQLMDGNDGLKREARQVLSREMFVQSIPSRPASKRY